MKRLNHRPQVLTHGVFDKIFRITEFLKMDEETRTRIKQSMTTERDLKNQFAYVRKEGFAVGLKEGKEEGREEGKAEGRPEGRAEGREAERVEVAKRMLACGMEIEQITELTQLSVDKIKALQ